MKKSSLLLATAIVVSGGLKAEAYDFNDKIYGKANAMIGYSLNFVKPMDDYESTKHHHLQIQGGYNVYFKSTDLIHPFVGMRVGINAPLAKEDMMQGMVKLWAMNSLFYVEAVAGAKFNVVKKFAVQPYVFLGYSLSRYVLINNYFENKTRDNVNNLSTGVGIDGIYELSDKIGLIAGIEYKYIGCGQMVNVANNNVGKVDVNATHQMGIHFGVQFL